jgi:molybdenum cofactor synthesis domain-containing protein
VENGQEAAGCRVIPLVVAEQYLKQVENLCNKFGPVIKVSPYRKMKVGIVTTGNEVFQGLIKDKFGPVMKAKLQYFGAGILGQTFSPDNIEIIKDAILKFKDSKADLIIVTGGMSVDPDDLTPGAIKQTGADVITYGAPVQPGNMFMMAYLNDTAILGVPACAMFMKTTILDAVLKRVFAGHILQEEDFIRMGEGGFCSKCEICHYPRCSFCQ